MVQRVFAALLLPGLLVPRRFWRGRASHRRNLWPGQSRVWSDRIPAKFNATHSRQRLRSERMATTPRTRRHGPAGGGHQGAER